MPFAIIAINRFRAAFSMELVKETVGFDPLPRAYPSSVDSAA